MNNKLSSAGSASEALNTIAEIKTFLKGTTEVPVEPFQFVVLGVFFYAYPIFNALIAVIRGSYHSYLAMNDYWAYHDLLSWTGGIGVSDSEGYLRSFAGEALYATVFFCLIHWVAKKFFSKKLDLNPIGIRVQNIINGVAITGFIAGYGIAYTGTLDHMLPLVVIGSGICFFIIGQFTRAIVRYCGIALGIIGLVSLLSLGTHNAYTFNLILFLTASTLLGTGFLMMLENRLTGRLVK